MICNAKLSNSSLALAKLKEHFLKLHGDGEYKNTSDVNARFILYTSKTYNYVLNLKKNHILFFNKEGFGECAYETGGVQYLQQG